MSMWRAGPWGQHTASLTQPGSSLDALTRDSLSEEGKLFFFLGRLKQPAEKNLVRARQAATLEGSPVISSLAIIWPIRQAPRTEARRTVIHRPIGQCACCTKYIRSIPRNGFPEDIDAR